MLGQHFSVINVFICYGIISSPDHNCFACLVMIHSMYSLEQSFIMIIVRNIIGHITYPLQNFKLRWPPNVFCWVTCCMNPPLSLNCGCCMIIISSYWDVVMPTATSTPLNWKRVTTPSDCTSAMRSQTSWKSCLTCPSLFLQNWLRRYILLMLCVSLFSSFKYLSFHPSKFIMYRI